jgi:alpha-L-fucosidase
VVLESEFLFEEAPFLQSHASTIAEVNGNLLVAYFGGTYERHSDVSIYLQRQDGGGWTYPERIADGIVNDTLRYPTWNPVLFYKDRILSLYYKMGPSPDEWWGMVIKSYDEGKTWTKPQALPDGFLGPIKNKPIETGLTTLLFPSSVEYPNGVWKAHIERSDNGGKSWKRIEIPSPDSVKIIQPSLLEFPNGRILALLRSNQDRVMQSWSYDDGKTWTAVSPTTVPNPNSGLDAVASKSGHYFLVNNAMESGNSWEMGRNKLYVYASNDGYNWSQILKLEDEEVGEFSYPAIIEAADGTIHITYSYDRKRIKYVKLSY